MDRSGRRTALLIWIGVVACVLAVLAIVVSAVGYARVTGKPGVHLERGAQQVVLPANQTYGIYVDDADNSGYNERCSAVDSQGQEVTMADPGLSMSESATETLDIVFNTGSGNLTIDCSIPGEQVSVRAVPDFRALVLGVALGGMLGLAGLILLLLGLVERFSSRQQNPWSASSERIPN